MKRALAICAALFAFGVLGMGWSISGQWSTSLNVLPTVGLDSTTLTLTADIEGYTITSTSTFGAAGFTTQSFALAGTVAFADIKGYMAFDPAYPAYKNMWLSVDLDLLGVGIGARVDHIDMAYFGQLGMSPRWPVGRGEFPCPTEQTPSESAFMMYTLTADVDPFGSRVRFVDCCYGIFFYDLLITFDDLYLCCGVDFDFELSFTKAGFNYAKFTFSDLFTIMDYWTYDITITYGVDYKSVGVDVDFDFPANVCLEVLVSSDGLFDLTLDGFSIKCELNDCNSVMFGTAFPMQRLIFAEGKTYYFTYDETKGTLSWSDTANDEDFSWTADADWYGYGVKAPAAWGLKSGWIHFFNDGYDISWNWLEFELVELGFCGPGCCGGDWTIDIAMYWAEVWEVDLDVAFADLEWTQVYPTLFGLSRISFDASVPLMEGFSLDLGFAHTLLPVANPTELTMGWTFKF